MCYYMPKMVQSLEDIEKDKTLYVQSRIFHPCWKYKTNLFYTIKKAFAIKINDSSYNSIKIISVNMW